MDASLPSYLVRIARLSTGLGLKAIEHGHRVLFTTAAAMIATLTRALAEGRLEDKLKAGLVRPEEPAAIS